VPQLIQPAGVHVDMGFRLKLVLSVFLGMALMQTAGAQQPPARDAERPAPVQITHGPVVESVTGTTAIIAWSTNVNAGTSLRYGTAADHLDKAAGMPWGGFTHRVYLKNLQAGTKYYFQAESGKAQGTGTTATSEVKSFQTKPADAESQLNDECFH
jgi:Purple acid Phosphatase, N-terminal domain